MTESKKSGKRARQGAEAVGKGRSNTQKYPNEMVSFI